MCLLYDGNSRGSTKIGFMEKPGIEPGTPGLQDIGIFPTPGLLHKVMGNAFPEPLFSAFIMLTESFYNGVQNIGPFTDAHLIQCYIP